MRSKGHPTAEPKFRAGERVRLAASAMKWGVAEGGYVVTKQLPERDGEFEYRIKSMSEPQERVAREGELARE
jgi:hypothetical protein